MKKIGIKCVSILLLLVFVSFYVIWDRGRVKDWGFEANAPAWLPKGAEEVTFLRTGSSYLAEFKIEEKELSKWCRDTGMGLGMLLGCEEKVVQRPHVALAERGLIEPFSLPKEGVTEWDLYRQKKWREMKFVVGDYFFTLPYDLTKPRKYTLAYDVNKRKAYYSRSF